MRRSSHLLTLFAIVAACAFVAHAQWPTTLRENLPVAASPTCNEMYPVALPYPGGATMVAFLKSMPDQGNYYQIINRYGQLQYPTPEPMTPAGIDPGSSWPQVIPDGSGGAFVAWYVVQGGQNPGYWVQRLDSLGNRLWGEAGVRLTTWESPLNDLDISADGQGGFFLASHNYFPANGIWAQHLDWQGQPLWGEGGLIVIPATPWGEGYPEIAPDGLGGLYMLWLDGRPPYYGALFMNRFGSSGNPLWGHGIFIYETGGSSYYWELLADGVGGVIAHYGGGNINTVKRVDPNGAILWERRRVSWWSTAKIMAGEPGFFYLGFSHTDGWYGQRMDIRGNTYWPTPGSLRGALMMAPPAGWGGGWVDYFYQYPYFYAMTDFLRPPLDVNGSLNAQIADSAGNRLFGEKGVMLTYNQDIANLQYKSVIPDGEGGLVGVFQTYDYDIYAKHMNADGSLGGPSYAPIAPTSSPQMGQSLENVTLQSGSVSYTLPEASAVKLELFDILGRKAAILRDEFQMAGTHEVAWDRKNLPSGIYLLKLSTPKDRQILKIAIVH